MRPRQDPELWCVDLTAAAPALRLIEEQTPRLSADDAARASAFSDAAARDEWVATRIALRMLIERMADEPWRGVAFQREERGRPYLAGAELAFSLSHAPGLALIALASKGPIGVDVERMRTVRIDAVRRARIREAGAALSTAALPEKEESAFLQAWVRLEAFAKADGRGIGRVLSNLGISGAGSRSVIAEGERRSRAEALLVEGPAHHVRDLQLAEGAFAAIALGRAPERLAVQWLPTAVADLEKLVN